ncbi:hypothetical protein SLS56_008302 [Neofusicoccum ribis]|uniref:Uncharacterized protein n=1 Tax=Neofusicoccum ribis TaxID=45134 RepID=A0ABR3SL19_9PEZI
MSETLEFLGNMGLMEAVKLSTILLGCISAGALLFYSLDNIPPGADDDCGLEPYIV